MFLTQDVRLLRGVSRLRVATVPSTLTSIVRQPCAAATGALAAAVHVALGARVAGVVGQLGTRSERGSPLPRASGTRRARCCTEGPRLRRRAARTASSTRSSPKELCGARGNAALGTRALALHRTLLRAAKRGQNDACAGPALCGEGRAHAARQRRHAGGARHGSASAGQAPSHLRRRRPALSRRSRRLRRRRALE